MVSLILRPLTGYLGDRSPLAHIVASITDLESLLEETHLYRFTGLSQRKSHLQAACASARSLEIVLIDDRRNDVLASCNLFEIARRGGRWQILDLQLYDSGLLISLGKLERRASCREIVAGEMRHLDCFALAAPSKVSLDDGSILFQYRLEELLLIVALEIG